MPSTHNAMALAYALRYTPAVLNRLYEQVDSIDTIIEHRNDIRMLIPEASERLDKTLRDMDEAFRMAEQEWDYCRQHDIQILHRDNPDSYPARLLSCDDAPFVLYYRGNIPLNERHLIAIVGTRHATTYGKDIIRQLMKDLRQRLPKLVIVSGLAYGIDIAAHREALAQGMNTIGVLAHGLQTIYPASHRNDANRIVGQGGLLTEYMSHTKADKMQFVQRNRIVAAITDATVVIESAHKGGALITAHIAREYNREVMAFPGRITDTYSAGCNRLIADNVASLVTNADQLIDIMGWQDEVQQQGDSAVEGQLFPTLTEDEQRIVNALRQNNDLNVNILAVQTGIGIGQLFSLLFNLEMKGLVKPYAGGTYHLTTP